MATYAVPARAAPSSPHRRRTVDQSVEWVEYQHQLARGDSSRIGSYTQDLN